MSGVLLSRRRLLQGTGASLACMSLHAAESPELYGIGALIDGKTMVTVPPGEFLMGSDFGNSDEEPAHRVRLTRPFEIGKFEVTQAQWHTVMTNPHAKTGVVHQPEDGSVVGINPSQFKGASLPVERVSWDDIQLFLKRLNSRDEKHVYRLPTEAEWEYAAKGGKLIEDPAQVNATAWYKDNSEEHTQPVGLKQANAWKLHDMLGNVSEWVQDWYAADYYTSSPRVDPAGPPSGSYRVFRGACWFDPAKYCRASYRAFDFPINRFYNVGFRVVRTPA